MTAADRGRRAPNGYRRRVKVHYTLGGEAGD
jgi:hypothetical protein